MSGGDLDQLPTAAEWTAMVDAVRVAYWQDCRAYSLRASCAAPADRREYGVHLCHEPQAHPHEHDAFETIWFEEACGPVEAYRAMLRDWLRRVVLQWRREIALVKESS